MSVLRLVLCVAVVSVWCVPPHALAQQNPARVERGLIVLYDFSKESGLTIHDRAGRGAPLDLTIEDGSGRVVQGALVIEAASSIVSAQPAVKFLEAVKKSNELSVEAWLKPVNGSQAGPARILTISADTGQRNLTLGQEQDAYDVRLRATGSDRNGMPSTTTPKKLAESKLTHVVYTRDAQGTATIFVDGKQVTQKSVGGNLGNWDATYRLALANELSKDRPWLGELHLVALYDRALTAAEVQQNFAARVLVAGASSPSPATFDSRIAPLFAKHCLECHDSAIKKGGLDLSRKQAALAGGESGPAIAPGTAKGSLLWEAVAADDMPKGRAPLSAEEKTALRKWLEAGAAWPQDVIDPANYVHGGQVTQVWVQRLTVQEYIETVRATVGVDIAKEARELLPPDLRADGFSNTAYNLNVDLKHVEAYGRLAKLSVERMDVLKFAARFSKSQLLSTDDTMRDHVAAMGQFLLRGPLDRHEIDSYSGIATTVASAGGDFKTAMSYIIEAMLQSPRFVYRIEDQRGDGTRRAVTPFELATRVSYIIWGGPPDAELLRAAEKNELADQLKLAFQVQRMLMDPRAIARSKQFVSQWLDLERLQNLQPNAEKFPAWNAALATDMHDETLEFFEDVVWKQQRPLSDLLNAQVTYATPRLAKFYGLKPQGDSLSKYDLTDVPARGGLLTQGSVLTVGGDDASMVSRGLFVLQDLLRGTINAPPPCVNTTPPPTKAGLTQRGISEARIANEQCGVCHARFEPLAFGLERFDGIGGYHEQDEHGNPLRDDGAVLFPGEAEPIPYRTSAELMDLLAGSPRVRQSLTWKVTQFALGRPLVAADAPSVAAIHQSAQQGGGFYASLITAIVFSDLVQTKCTEKVE